MPVCKDFWPALDVNNFVSGLLPSGLTTKAYSLLVSTATGALNNTLVATVPVVDVFMFWDFSVTLPNGNTLFEGNPFCTSLSSTKAPKVGFFSAKYKSSPLIYPVVEPSNIVPWSKNDWANGSTNCAHINSCDVRPLSLIAEFLVLALIPLASSCSRNASGHSWHGTILPAWRLPPPPPRSSSGSHQSIGSGGFMSSQGLNLVSSNTVFGVSTGSVLAPIPPSSSSIVVTTWNSLLVVEVNILPVSVDDNIGALVDWLTSVFSKEKLKQLKLAEAEDTVSPTWLRFSTSVKANFLSPAIKNLAGTKNRPAIPPVLFAVKEVPALPLANIICFALLVDIKSRSSLLESMVLNKPPGATNEVTLTSSKNA